MPSRSGEGVADVSGPSREPDDAGAKDASSAGERRMTFAEHLDELRVRLWRIVLALMVAGAIAFLFQEALTKVLLWPWNRLAETGVAKPLMAVDVTEGFLTYMKAVMTFAVLFSAPVAAYQLWQFVAAGLYPAERRSVMTYFPLSVLLFAVMVAFGYFLLLPTTLSFLVDYAGNLIDSRIRVNSYLSLFFHLTVVLAVASQLPLLLLFLIRTGIATREGLAGMRRHFVLAAFIAAAVLTPTQDPVTMLLVALPLWLLFELGLFLGGRTERPVEESQP